MALTAVRPTKAQTHKPTNQTAAIARLSVDVPADLLAELKATAARRRTSIREIIIRLVEADLAR